MPPFIVENLVTCCISAATTLIGGIALYLYKDNRRMRKSRKQQHEDYLYRIESKQDLFGQAMVYVLGSVIQDEIMRIFDRGKVRTVSETSHISSEYKIYESLGGNSVVHDMYVRFMAMKVVEDDYFEKQLLKEE